MRRYPNGEDAASLQDVRGVSPGAGITIEDGPRQERRHAARHRYDIDMVKSFYCGLCQELYGRTTMSEGPNFRVRRRRPRPSRGAYYDKERLLEKGDSGSARSPRTVLGRTLSVRPMIMPALFFYFFDGVCIASDLRSSRREIRSPVRFISSLS